MSGVNVRQLRELVICPALQAIGLHSEAAELLVLGTAATESHFEDLKQVGGGPALGLWQMEPATYNSLWADMLAQRLELKTKVLSACRTLTKPPAERLISDLTLGAVMCRLRYLWDPRPLPAATDLRGLAETHKRAYNTVLGVSTPEKFMADWNRLVAPNL